jgi:hypothetical protein
VWVTQVIDLDQVFVIKQVGGSVLQFSDLEPVWIPL